MIAGIRVGIDVGGTFTKAVAVEGGTRSPRATAVVATTHRSPGGVAEGVADALRALLRELKEDASRVELVTFSTTQAMNALLEGDVAPVGVVGIGAHPDLGRARRRTRVGNVKLAPGRVLRTVHEFLDATGRLAESDVDAALDRLERAGCLSVAVSGAFAVDAPEHEDFVVERALARGLPACAGHDLTGAYGLETRTVSAAVNASILPVVEATATLVGRALDDADLRVPLLVLRGDGGAMSVEAFLHRPSLTIGSGPAAGVAAALHQLEISDGIVVECGGTSSNVSIVRRGRAVLRTLKVMGRPTCIRSIDSWVVGAAGGSMARVGRRHVTEVGPRSAHIAGLPYASFAEPGELAGARLELVAPRPGDTADYAVVVAGGRRWGLTATCAANALGLVVPGAHAHGSRDAALAAFAPLAERLRVDPEHAARAVLDAAVAKVADAVGDAARAHELGREVPLVVLGGAGDALVPEVARALGREVVRPDHAEVLSSVGAALSLVRAEVTRTAGSASPLELTREAERACVASGAAPLTVSVETAHDSAAGVMRAVATGAVALESGAAERVPLPDEGRLRAAATALEVEPGRLGLVASNEYYRVYSENGSGRVAVVDTLGAVPVAEDATRVFAAVGDAFLERLGREVDDRSLKLGLATLLPRVVVVCGPHVLDLSEARQADEILRAAERVLAEHGDAVAVAVVAR
jgi:N-methylhydantoinase A/oxoprolinase/acetone carboxylase beta subunit